VTHLQHPKRAHLVTASLIALAAVLCYVRTLWCG